ncbi:MAG: phosphoenolpyruvate--protein phosphotransferase [Aestuariivirga sp.]
MPGSALGPRVLLKRLREVMAEPETAQKRLDKIVTLIAANMVAEVCSIYVMRPGDFLELYATEGLKREAVHKSRLKTGEGLVGLIAQQAIGLSLSDAQHHPAFKYLPETGEEIYNAFLGVPIMRGGSVMGVLVVQNRTQRHYTDEEEEALQTTAMVLAEVIASGELREVAREVAADVAHVRSHHLRGESLADGIALGLAVLHEPRVAIENMIAENIPEERKRLQKAVEKLRTHVDELLDGSDEAEATDYSDVLETIRMFARDKGWVNRLNEAVDTGLTAEAAVERVQTDNRARMMRTGDAYLRERMHDLDDLSNRLLRILTGAVATASRSDLPANSIIVARNMGPAELLDYDRSKIRGVILEEGGKTSHVAIVARALGIPAVGQAVGLIDLVDTGSPIIVDGATGELFVRPSPDLQRAYAEKVRFYARKQAQFAELRDKPALTRDGVKIELNINAGLIVDMPHLHDSGADGVGLYRTELQFMLAQRFPRLASQMKHYGAIIEQAKGKPVVFRTLDIGADKTLPYLRQPKEENPALGWRSIRMALDRPALLRLQVRALMLAGAGLPMKIMFPMIADVDEYRRAAETVEAEKTYLAARGHQLPSQVRLGVMIEIPSLVWQLDQILPIVDFASIGSNDLVQFLFASDRGNPRLAGRYDPLSPSALLVMRTIVEAAERHKKPVTLCGELGGRPLEAMGLVGIGLTSISMVPSAIGPVKAMIMSLDRAKLWSFLEPLLRSPAHSIRGDLLEFAQRQGVTL